MARDVADAALMLDAMAGPHPEDPLAIPAPPEPFLTAALSPELPARIAWSDDLGITPVEPEVRAVCLAAIERLAAAGVGVAEAHPDLGARASARFSPRTTPRNSPGSSTMWRRHSSGRTAQSCPTSRRPIQMLALLVAHERRLFPVARDADGL